MRARVAALVWSCALAVGCAPSLQRPLRTGARLEVAGEQSYAIYLPSHYSRARRWPIIFGFSPMGRGADVTERLADAAEKYGYIVLASNVSENGDVGPTLSAQDAMWRDAHAWLSVDDAHTYATGFSGGARASVVMAQRYPLRGIIACGAFAARAPGSEDKSEVFGSHLPHVVVNNFGDADMNAAEMHAIAAAIDPAKHFVWSEEFVGPHAWPPTPIYAELLELLELDARRAAGGGEAFEKTLVAARLADVRAWVAAGEGRLARLKLQQIARLFPNQPLPDIAIGDDSDADARATGLLDLLDVSQDLQELEAAWPMALQLARTPGQLQRRALAQVNGAPWRAAFRALRAHERGDEPVAAALIAFAETHTREAAPERRATALYNLARAQAQLGRKREAIDSLNAAFDAGYHSPGALAQDPALQPLRSEPAFGKLKERM